MSAKWSSMPPSWVVVRSISSVVSVEPGQRATLDHVGGRDAVGHRGEATGRTSAASRAVAVDQKPVCR